MTILVTGGAGYIGSHTCVELLNAGYEIIVLDNFYNSKPEVLKRIRKITGKDFKFYDYDLLDRDKVESVFKDNKIDAVIHFAGYKAVAESVLVPLKYFYNNLTGTIILCQVMEKFNCKKLVFSSSATVYGVPDRVPIVETDELSVTNPYGRTKLMIEEMLGDVYAADKSWSITLLRYFNPIGAHESGIIGEDPQGIPNNLMPYITQVAIGRMPELSVFGNDYPTVDGTGVRDYIHVVDLAKGHIKALEKIMKENIYEAYNLGTGNGYSVLQMITTFEKVSGKKVPYKFAPRRPGDVASCYANPEKAHKELGWKAEYDLERMCQDSWRWQSQNPMGYED